jgi:hypothetical protein
MNMPYPDGHHPVMFLEAELRKFGADVQFLRSVETCNLWGLRVNGKLFVWLIDNRWSHERQMEDPAASEMLKRGALVCHAQKRDCERVGGKWLPLAATPGYFPMDVTKEVEVAFVGYIRDGARAGILSDVASRYRVSIGQGVFGEAANRMYAEAYCGLNVPTRYGELEAYDFPMRGLEIPATGVPLVTNFLPELEDMGLRDGVNCVLYRSASDVCPAIQRALTAADRIGAAGLQWVSAAHTYVHRAQTVLEWLT